MVDDTRVYIVKDLISEYLKSPSLRHVRDPYAVSKLALKIVRRLDGSNSAWKKWNGPREFLVKSAMQCWVPTEDMRDHLNSMEGPPLTTTDVTQRMRAFQEESHFSYPDERLQKGCLALYNAEKAIGTEMPAIVGALQEHVEVEEHRLRVEQDEARRARYEQEKNALEQRFLSGADSKWTTVGKSRDFYCRINGRAYRLSPTPDKRWELHRIKSVDDNGGPMLGKYGSRGDVTKALAQMAYQPDVI